MHIQADAQIIGILLAATEACHHSQLDSSRLLDQNGVQGSRNACESNFADRWRCHPIESSRPISSDFAWPQHSSLKRRILAWMWRTHFVELSETKEGAVKEKTLSDETLYSQCVRNPFSTEAQSTERIRPRRIVLGWNLRQGRHVDNLPYCESFMRQANGRK